MFALLLKWQQCGFLVFWFGIGALITMIVSLIFPENIFLQVSVFVAVSTLLIFLTKPLVEMLTRKDKNVATNAFSIIGKKGIVLQDINENYGIGQIKVAGEVWSAKTTDGGVIEKGTQVEVIQIDGVKAVVEPVSVSTNIFVK